MPMPESRSLKIVGLGCYLPKRVVPSSEVEKRCGLPEGWAYRKTGVMERRWVNGETSSYMGCQAASQAIAEAGLKLTDIDLILNASGTQPQAIPDGAHLLQRELGLGDSGIPCMTVHTTCLSFLTAMDVSSALLATGRYRHILIVSTDIASTGIDFEQPESAVLFGDAAAAAVVTTSPAGEPSAILASRMESYSEGADFTRILGGGTNRHPNDPRTTRKDNLFDMNGPRVYKLGNRIAGPFLEKLRPGLSSGLGSISLVVPHQASILAIRSLRHFGVPDDRVCVTLDRYGNCVAASLPLTLCLAVQSGRLRRGDEVLLIGTGAGLCIGGMILVY